MVPCELYYICIWISNVLGFQEQNYQYLVQVEVYLARALTPIEGDEEELP